ncbi:MAG TPA: amidohydrolase [Candidatus Alectryocaccobium stercorigallinarum]|nr:amidohydrolase [Candidatus Alectryocaccobium stercorigallinarum]
MNYKITNGTLLIHTKDDFITKQEDIYIKDNKIAHIGNIPENDDTHYETFDASGRLVMPGLINMHTHVYMTILRNYADDVDFAEWLFKRVTPVEDSLPAEAAYWTNLLGFAEMFRSGTTSYVDMHMYKCMSGKAANDCGMRAFIGRGLVGDDLYTDGLSRFNEALAEQEEYESGRIKIVLSPHAIYSASEKLYRQVSEEAQKRGLLKQTHLSESVTEVEDCIKTRGKTPVEYLNDIGFLDDGAILAHCVQMRGNDIGIIRKSGASVVTNPASNAKLGNGFAPVVKMHDAGINICIGTDGTSSNNTLNMFREMGLLSLIHKGIHKDSTAMPAQTVLAMATENAAKALRAEDELGAIKEGAAADLCFVDLRAPSLFPNNNIISSLCYSANGSEVDSLMIDGKFVMKNRELLTIDYDRVCCEIEKIKDKYL